MILTWDIKTERLTAKFMRIRYTNLYVLLAMII